MTYLFSHQTFSGHKKEQFKFLSDNEREPDATKQLSYLYSSVVLYTTLTTAWPNGMSHRTGRETKQHLI